MDEIKELKLEVEVLKRRLNRLENIENRRKVIAFVKALIIICIIVFLIVEGYKYYQKVMELYKDVSSLYNNMQNFDIKSFLQP